jgi:type VI secretion system Hcp family effector
MHSKIAMLATIVAGFLVATTASAATTEIYLKINSPTTIQGEVTASHYLNDIQLLSYSQSVQSPASIGSGKGGVVAGTPTCGQITVTKHIDKSSPLLIQAVMSGELIGGATIYFVDTPGTGVGPGPGGVAGAGAQQNDYTVTLTNALVTGVQQSDASPAELIETVTLLAAQFKVHYVPYTARGTTGAAVDFSVDCTGGLAF